MQCNDFGLKPRVAWTTAKEAGRCNCCNGDEGGRYVYVVHLRSLEVRLCAECMNSVIKQAHAK